MDKYLQKYTETMNHMNKIKAIAQSRYKYKVKPNLLRIV
jgi:hypothetical protein